MIKSIQEKVRYVRRSADNREKLVVALDTDATLDWAARIAAEGQAFLALRASELQEDLHLPAMTDGELEDFRQKAARSGFFVFALEYLPSDTVNIFRVIGPDRCDAVVESGSGKLSGRFAGYTAVSRSFLQKTDPKTVWTKPAAHRWAARVVGDRLWGFANRWLYCWIYLRDGEVADSGDGYVDPEEALEAAKTRYPAAAFTESELANHPYARASGKFIALTHR